MSVSLSGLCNIRGYTLCSCSGLILYFTLTESILKTVFPFCCVVLNCRSMLECLWYLFLSLESPASVINVLCNLSQVINESIESYRLIADCPQLSFFIHPSLWMMTGLQLPQFSFSNCFAFSFRLHFPICLWGHCSREFLKTLWTRKIGMITVYFPLSVRPIFLSVSSQDDMIELVLDKSINLQRAHWFFFPNSLYSVSIKLIVLTAPVPPLKQGINLVLS